MAGEQLTHEFDGECAELGRVAGHPDVFQVLESINVFLLHGRCKFGTVADGDRPEVGDTCDGGTALGEEGCQPLYSIPFWTIEIGRLAERPTGG